MRTAALQAMFFVLTTAAFASTEEAPPDNGPDLRVMLLGTAGGPTMHAHRLGISTVVEAGPEKLLFDAGRSTTTGMERMSVNPAEVTKVFLTHLHSDHVISLPELMISPWASRARKVPLEVWGPTGTRSMMEHFERALSFDIHIRRDVDEKFPAEGIRVVTTEIKPGVVYEANGVKVTAFLVDHAPIVPAYGFRIDYRGRSVVLSGDTRPSANLVKHSVGVDLLIHELTWSKDDPRFQGPADEIIPWMMLTHGQARAIAEHHTDATQAGEIFKKVRPRLAVFSHYGGNPKKLLPRVRKNYAGPVEFGEDLMTIEVGKSVNVRRFDATVN